MNTYKHLIYMIFDELKISSDDSFINENHIAFLLNKYRNVLLKQKYDNLVNEVPETSYQTICLDLEHIVDCMREDKVKSIQEIPKLLTLGDSILRYDISPIDDQFNNITWTLISRDRFKYVGNNKWLHNIIYFTIGLDNYLYLKSSNIDYKYIKRITLSGVFEDPLDAHKLSYCYKECDNCDIYDIEFPLDDYLIPTLIQMIIKELQSTIYRPEDKDNNADDDLSNINN